MTEREEIYLKGLEQGMKDQKNIVLKLIDEKIAECRKESFAESDEAIGILEELKEELRRK